MSFDCKNSSIEKNSLSKYIFPTVFKCFFFPFCLFNLLSSFTWKISHLSLERFVHGLTSLHPLPIHVIYLHNYQELKQIGPWLCCWFLAKNTNSIDLNKDMGGEECSKLSHFHQIVLALIQKKIEAQILLVMPLFSYSKLWHSKSNRHETPHNTQILNQSFHKKKNNQKTKTAWPLFQSVSELYQFSVCWQKKS